MRHHQTRRKGRSLKKQNRSTRRRQQGGAVIASASDWFKAIDAFESRKSDLGSNYSFASLTDADLTLPETVTADTLPNYAIGSVNISYPPTPLPKDYIQSFVDINLIEIAQFVSYMFNGETFGDGLINLGYNTLSTFIDYAKNVKSILDNTENGTGYEIKRSMWFLNEIETALQNASGKTKDRGFTSIYEKPTYPFYIMYLAANPVKLPNKPDLTPLPLDFQMEIESDFPK